MNSGSGVGGSGESSGPSKGGAGGDPGGGPKGTPLHSSPPVEKKKRKNNSGITDEELLNKLVEITRKRKAGDHSEEVVKEQRSLHGVVKRRMDKGKYGYIKDLSEYLQNNT